MLFGGRFLFCFVFLVEKKKQQQLCFLSKEPIVTYATMRKKSFLTLVNLLVFCLMREREKQIKGQQLSSSFFVAADNEMQELQALKTAALKQTAAHSCASTLLSASLVKNTAELHKGVITL